MTIDKTKINEISHSQDQEIENLRNELESMLRRENLRLEKEKEQAFLRMDQIAMQSFENAAAEWGTYEVMLSSAREEFLCESRKEMERLFDLEKHKENEDGAVSKILHKILQVDPFEKVVSEN